MVTAEGIIVWDIIILLRAKVPMRKRGRHTRTYASVNGFDSKVIFGMSIGAARDQRPWGEWTCIKLGNVGLM